MNMLRLSLILGFILFLPSFFGAKIPMPKSVLNISVCKVSRLLLLASLSAIANDRHFGYTYETATMPKGTRELEMWSTARIGHDEFYSRLDHRMEFETGLTDHLQTSLYLNWENVSSEDGAGGIATDFAWKGISSEWKYKLTDPVANLLGTALYGEIGYNTDEIELEGKVLLDKKIGRVLLATNFVGEMEFAAEGTGFDLEEYELEFDFGVSYEFSHAFSLGLELRNHNEIAKLNGKDMEFEHSALFLGPTVAYSAKSWWMTFTVLPQLPALHAQNHRHLVLDEHEVTEARLLFSLHL
jgi:hypothetical protein